MLLLKIKKNLSALYPKNPALFNLVNFSSSLSSAAAAKTFKPPPKSNPIADFLINSCGFSSQKAASAAKFIKFTSVEQADSVRHFFKHQSFDDTSIRKLISKYPGILHADVEKTLQPRLETLYEMGFTKDELHVLVVSNPALLVNQLAIPRLEFWQNFLGKNNRELLVRVFRRNRNLISMDIVTGIVPKIALLKEHGLSPTNIIGILRRGPCLIGLSSRSIEALLKRAEELGFCSQSSSMFTRGLSALCGIRVDEFNAKMELFKGFGWSEEEFHDALKKSPNFITLSEDTIRKKMEFLLGSVGCKQSYIASCPLLLMISLEKRLMPRHCVMEILKSNGIVGRKNFYTTMMLSENKFLESFVLPYEKQLPKIRETYLAACAGHLQCGKQAVV